MRAIRTVCFVLTLVGCAAQIPFEECSQCKCNLWIDEKCVDWEYKNRVINYQRVGL